MPLTTMHERRAARQRGLATLLVPLVLVGCKQPTPQEACATAVQQLAFRVVTGKNNFTVAVILMALALLGLLLADLNRLKPARIGGILLWTVGWMIGIFSLAAVHEHVGLCSAAGELSLADGIPWGWIDFAAIGGGLLLVFAAQPVSLGYVRWIVDVADEKAHRRRMAQDQANIRRLETQEAMRLTEQDLQSRRQNVAQQLSGIENTIRAATEISSFEVKRNINQALDRIAADLDKTPAVMTEPLRQRARTAAAALKEAGSMDALFKTRWQQLFGIRA